MDRPCRHWLLLALSALVLALLLCTGLLVDPKAGAQSEVILVAPTALAVTEPAEEATFVLSLTSQPVATVTIELQVDGDECAVSPETLLLDGTNWEAGATATVTAQDDAIIDGEQPCTVVTAAASSTDLTFNGEDPDDVAVTVADDDVAGFSYSPAALTLAEPAGQGTFTVSLTSQPLDAVTFGLAVGSDECTVSPGRLELTTANWQVGATVTVTVQDDDVADGEQLCIVEMGRTKSTDPNYDHLTPPEFEVTVTDDDGPRLSVSPAALTLAEPAGQGTFTLTLTSQPAATVTVGLQAGSDECTVSPESLLLDENNWQAGAPATVTVQDDDVVDGEQACAIVTAAAVSDDPSYNGEDPADVAVTVTDDEVARLSVRPATLTLAEPAGLGTFTLTLASQPATTVTVGLQAGSDECKVSPESLLLDENNWQAGAPATVTVQDDDIVDGEQACTIITSAAFSDDPSYNGEDPADVTVTVTDNDLAGFAVSPPALTLAEPAGRGSFSVTLTSQPTATVEIELQAGSDECQVLPGTLLLDAANWRAGVTATVTVQDDDVVDGEQACPIVTVAATSADPIYRGIDPDNVAVTVSDNDVAGMHVHPTILAVSEPDGTAAFAVTLHSQPVAPVTLGLNASNSECTVSPPSILLDAANWNDGAIVIVTAADDKLKDGNQTCVVQTALTTSADPNYDGRDPEDVIVAVYDDEIIRWVYLPAIVRQWPPVPGIPTLNPIDNADGDGEYTITWNATPHTELYVLEESTSSDFSHTTLIYSGPATSASVSGRGAARYYYRLKARIASDHSSWSSPVTADVLWEMEPNDQAPDQANGPLAPVLVYFGTFPTAEDLSDYYSFDLNAPRRVSVWLTAIPDDMNYDLVLRDANLAVEGYSGELSNRDEEIRTGILPAGRYYLQVFHRTGGGSSQPYRLRYVLE